MDRLQIRSELRGILQETLKFIIEEINEEIDIEATRIKRKRKWVNDKRKQDTSGYVFLELSVKGPTEHFSALRITKESFNWLFQRVEPYIQKTDTVMRMALPALLKLEIVLHLFATGRSLRTLELLFGVSKTSICLMIPSVCDAICITLQDYIRVPSNEEWKAVEAGFKNTWNFPGCCGAIDGKHVIMRSHSDTGQNKHQNKIALLALCDEDYCFKYIDVCCNENTLDTDVFRDSDLNKALENNLIPPNHVIVGDNKFPLERFLMKPYEGDDLSNKEKVFNYRLSRARHVIDNSFGFLVSRYRIFEKPLPFTPDKIEKLVKACCALHNWLRMTKCPIQVATLDVEDSDTGNIIPGSWRELLIEGLAEFPKKFQDCSSGDAYEIRDKYADYFMREGAISWQLQRINERE